MMPREYQDPQYTGQGPARFPGVVERHFYRCRDCLATFACDGPRISPACGACGATYAWHMGRVWQDRLTNERLDSACDHRCTNARGPACDCVCGGLNHGTGATVTIVTDAGRVPVAQVAATEELLAVAREWRAKLAEAEAALARMHASRRLERSAWRVADLIAKAREMTSSKRLTKLDQALELETRLSGLEGSR